MCGVESVLVFTVSLLMHSGRIPKKIISLPQFSKRGSSPISLDCRAFCLDLKPSGSATSAGPQSVLSEASLSHKEPVFGSALQLSGGLCGRREAVVVQLPDVLLQVKVAAEALPAGVAGEGLLVVVCVHVEGQVVDLVEGLVADGALVLLLSAVGQLVVLVVSWRHNGEAWMIKHVFTVISIIDASFYNRFIPSTSTPTFHFYSEQENETENSLLAA